MKAQLGDSVEEKMERTQEEEKLKRKDNTKRGFHLKGLNKNKPRMSVQGSQGVAPQPL